MPGRRAASRRRRSAARREAEAASSGDLRVSATLDRKKEERQRHLEEVVERPKRSDAARSVLPPSHRDRQLLDSKSSADRKGDRFGLWIVRRIVGGEQIDGAAACDAKTRSRVCHARAAAQPE